MTIRQEDIPSLSTHLYSVADSIAGREVRPRALRISALNYGRDHEIFWKRTAQQEPALEGLKLLILLRNMAPYRAGTKELTRKNSVTVAWVGASALSHVQRVTERKSISLSEDALAGIQTVVHKIHNGLESTFRSATRVDNDNEALYFLAQAGKLLEP